MAFKLKKKSPLDFIPKVGAAIGGFATEIFRAPQRAGIQLGKYGVEKLGIKIDKKPYIPKTSMEKAMLGDRPVEDVETIGERFLTDIGFKEETAKKYSVGTGLVFATLDVLPFTSGKSKVGKDVVKQISKLKSEKPIANLLKLSGVPDDIIEPYAKKLATVSDIKKVEEGFKQINRLTTETKLITPKIISRFPTKKETIEVIGQKGKAKLTKALESNQRRLDISTARKVGEGKVFNKMSSKIAKEVRTGELKLLKEGIKIRTSKDKVIKTLLDKAVDIENKKKAIYSYAKEFLPIKDRGKLLSHVAKAKTDGDLSSAFRRIETIKIDSIKKTLITDIEKAVDKIDTVPIKWQDKALEAMDKVSLKGMSKETTKKIEDLKSFLEKEPEARFMFGAKTLKQKLKIADLERTALNKLEYEKLVSLHAKVVGSIEEGKIASKLIKETKVLAKENSLKGIAKASNNIDTKIPNTLGANLSRKDRIVNKKYQVARQMKDGYMNYVSTDVGFEVLDNGVTRGINYRTFKEPFDEAFFNYKEMNAGVVDNYFSFKRALEKKYGKALDKANMERIMIYATKIQEGGREKLLKSGLNDLLPSGVTVDSLTLTPQEMEYYKYGREVMDSLYPQIDNTLRKVYGKKLGQIDNYWSMHTDFDSDKLVADKLQFDFLKSRTEQGFTKSRKIGAKHLLNFNAEEVLLKHVNDSTYFIHTQELLEDSGKVVRDSDYAKSVGKTGQKWVEGWIDLMSRKGTPKGYTPSWASELLRNLGHGVLGFRLSPVIKQPIAKITSSALLGKHTFKHDAQYFAQGLWKYVDDISKQQRFRTFDDPTFTEFAKSKSLAKWQEAGYQGIKYVDKATSNNVWYAAYRKSLDDLGKKFDLGDFKKGIADKEAVKEADLIVRRTQGSSEYKDLAKMLTSKNKTAMKALLHFQSFILNESYLPIHDAVYKSALKEKNVGKALGIITAYVASGVTEDYAATGISQLFANEKYAEEQREKEFTKRMFDAVITKVPFINNLYSMAEFEGAGIPIIDTFRSGVSGAKSAFTGVKEETRLKGYSRLAESLGSLLGISGAGQAGQLVRKFAIPETKKKIKFKTTEKKASRFKSKKPTSKFKLK